MLGNDFYGRQYWLEHKRKVSYTGRETETKLDVQEEGGTKVSVTPFDGRRKREGVGSYNLGYIVLLIFSFN